MSDDYYNENPSKDVCDCYAVNYDALRDDPAGLPAELRKQLSEHLMDCSSCRTYKSTSDRILTISQQLPQFDVPEKLTQGILAQLPAAAPVILAGYAGLVLPVSLICLAGIMTVAPMDSLDGLASTAIALLGLAAIQLLVSKVQPEELPV